MAKFSQISMNRLLTCILPLQSLFNEVSKNYDCSVVCGFRNEQEQTEAFNNKKSKVKYPNSKHNVFPSVAVDVAPCINGKISWNIKQCYFFAGYVLGVWNSLKSQKKVQGDLRLGADWDRDYDVTDQEFNDLVHFEILPS